MVTTGAVLPIRKGGAFLLEDSAPEDIFTPEDLTEEHLAIARTADEFWAKEIEPNLEAIRRQEPGVAVKLLRKSAELGLTAISIPEQFGGMGLDLASALMAEEHLGRDASYAGWHGAHTGIGTLPILYFGTAEQKRKYLPKLASVEMVAAYALTEPHAGSDALAARTRADLSSDGKHYILNGQKMWITNGGAADLFTVFAKVGGEKFTAFLVERSFGGITSGAEEKKMGIKGSSTTAVYFENVPVPVENVLGEVGRGHIIAFNILNMGRLKLGALAAGGAKDVLAICLRYAKERKAFGSAIAEFGAIQYKLAEMAIRIYAAEAISWRVVGLIQARLNGFSWEQPDSSQIVLKALEEHAPECSIVKVYGSEALDYVVDEGVQIHGGYGFHQDYAVERAYRDSRINRIFEGTNEINRLLISGMLLKRAARGQLELMHDIQGEKNLDKDADELIRLVRNAKRIALLGVAIAYQKYRTELEHQQEVLMNLADIIMESFAMESTFLRACKISAAGKPAIASEICNVSLRDAMARIEMSARNVLGACSEGDDLSRNISLLRHLADYHPVDAVALRRKMAQRLLARERYVI
ncbi:MAG: acyl-CoA dehydrogenase family protein [Acidobacteriaceae bacterium]|nr:acyl-CoA dehydrogenase family protein [Acidobacteriaceae bacterium]MBV9295114.1 acyl-CoA dehydrogenase family protein [Acidobacteriaceae bacterium]MBV9767056.1 acyl-CoA dehydrogenase family protein [Acidobacteriaceae bacterium]